MGLEKGASLLLVSLGLIECEGHSNGTRGTFGLDQVKQLFQSAEITSASALCTSLVEATSHFGSRIPACDDRTALALVRTA